MGTKPKYYNQFKQAQKGFNAIPHTQQGNSTKSKNLIKQRNDTIMYNYLHTPIPLENTYASSQQYLTYFSRDDLANIIENVYFTNGKHKGNELVFDIPMEIQDMKKENINAIFTIYINDKERVTIECMNNNFIWHECEGEFDLNINAYKKEIHKGLPKDLQQSYFDTYIKEQNIALPNGCNETSQLAEQSTTGTIATTAIREPDNSTKTITRGGK